MTSTENIPCIKKHYDFTILEMCETEFKLVNDMNLIFKNYEPFTAILPDNFNLKSVMEYLPEYSQFCLRIREGVMKHKNNISDLNDYFQNMAEEFKSVYTNYIYIYGTLEQDLAYVESNETLRNMMLECLRTAGNKLCLQSYLLRPIQRLMKYELLFESAFKDKTLSPEEKSILKETIECMKNISSHIDKLQYKITMEQKANNILNRIKGLHEPLTIDDVGALLYEGNIVEGSNRKRYFCLFQRLIFVLKITTDKKYSLKYYYKARDNINIMPNLEIPEIILGTKENKISIKLKSNRDKETMMKYLKVFLIINIKQRCCVKDMNFLDQKEATNLIDYMNNFKSLNADNNAELLDKLSKKSNQHMLQIWKNKKDNPNIKSKSLNRICKPTVPEDVEKSNKELLNQKIKDCSTPLTLKQEKNPKILLDEELKSSNEPCLPTSSVDTDTADGVNTIQPTPEESSAIESEQALYNTDTDDETSNNSSAINSMNEILTNFEYDIREMKNEEGIDSNNQSEISKLSPKSVRATIAIFDELSNSSINGGNSVIWSADILTQAAIETERLMTENNSINFDHDSSALESACTSNESFSDFDSLQRQEKSNTNQLESTDQKDPISSDSQHYKIKLPINKDISFNNIVFDNQEIVTESLNLSKTNTNLKQPSTISSSSSQSHALLAPNKFFEKTNSQTKSVNISDKIDQSSSLDFKNILTGNMISKIQTQLMNQYSNPKESSKDIKKYITPTKASTVGRRLMQLQKCLCLTTSSDVKLTIRVGSRILDVTELPESTPSDELHTTSYPD